MIVRFNAQIAPWPHVCDAMIAFAKWRERNPGYCYIRAPRVLRDEIARLCTHLALEDAYSFAADDEPREEDGAAWFDLSVRWEPPRDA